MAAIEFRVATPPGADPMITAAYRPRLRKSKEVYLNGGYYPVAEGVPTIAAALLRYEGTAAELNEVLQVAFEIGRRHERMRLQEEAARASRRK
ncbi:MAG TPA: hypothetical protein VFL98_03065 [Candidatus Paceibacterota bacterium]|nr:hypothetical protein [Candidatus Paceibacterota bacterium]